MSTRLDKVNALVSTELNAALGRELAGANQFATVTAVETTADLREATCWISLLPESDALWEEVAELRGRLQQHLAERLELKRTPVITLRRDRGAAHASRVAEILKR